MHNKISLKRVWKKVFIHMILTSHSLIIRVALRSNENVEMARVLQQKPAECGLCNQ